MDCFISKLLSNRIIAFLYGSTFNINGYIIRYWLDIIEFLLNMILCEFLRIFNSTDHMKMFIKAHGKIQRVSSSSHIYRLSWHHKCSICSFLMYKQIHNFITKKRFRCSFRQWHKTVLKDFVGVLL